MILVRIGSAGGVSENGKHLQTCSINTYVGTLVRMGIKGNINANLPPYLIIHTSFTFQFFKGNLNRQLELL
jgi:hypothetical protein